MTDENKIDLAELETVGRLLTLDREFKALK